MKGRGTDCTKVFGGRRNGDNKNADNKIQTTKCRQQNADNKIQTTKCRQKIQTKTNKTQTKRIVEVKME